MAWKSRRRMVSNLVGLMIILGILVAIGIVVAAYTGVFTQKMKPQTPSVALVGAKARFLTSNRYYAEISFTINNIGGTSVRVVAVWVVYQSGTTFKSTGVTGLYPPSWYYMSPGHTITYRATVYFGTTGMPGLWAPIDIVVRYCDASGKCGETSISTKIEPYIP